MNVKGMVNIDSLNVTAKPFGKLKILNNHSKNEIYSMFWEKAHNDNFILKFSSNEYNGNLEKYISDTDLFKIVSIFLLGNMETQEWLIDLYNWEPP
ncbi:hypothetical protein [Staphylococcus aureus]|uniref:hypothetical protein n=1 Tax=Staphylococcus aureus TaxID=1280 RepID=UPI00124520AC|nr:hypothetical protein [Staphylococcus aureus]